MVPPHFGPQPWFLIDVIASLVSMLACLFIYFRTREYYRLTKHEGIAYFRLAFLFFGLGFLMPLFHPLLRPLLGRSAGLVMTFVGTLAILSLLYSAVHKRFRMAIHPLAAIILVSFALSLLPALFHFRAEIIVLQGVLFLAAVLLSHDHKKGSLHALYALLFLSWLANVGSRLAMRTTEGLSPLLSVLSAALFLVVAYKVWRSTRH